MRINPRERIKDPFRIVLPVVFPGSRSGLNRYVWFRERRLGDDVHMIPRINTPLIRRDN